MTAIDRTAPSLGAPSPSHPGDAPRTEPEPSRPASSNSSDSGNDPTPGDTAASALTWALVGLLAASLVAAVAVGFAGPPELAMAIAGIGTAIAGSIQLSRR